jgi:hypothetical protein
MTDVLQRRRLSRGLQIVGLSDICFDGSGAND